MTILSPPARRHVPVISSFGRLADLKYGDKARAIEIAEANNNYQQANRLRKQLIKIQDVES